MSKFIFSGAILLGLGMLVMPGTALAYETRMTATTECRASETADWVVDWTVVAGNYPGDTWEIISPSPSGYTPAGPQSALNDFTKTSSYPSSQASATDVITASWGADWTHRTRSATINRPPVCNGGTTTTTTTVSDTTTTTDDVTTTTDDVTTTTDDVTSTTDDVTSTTDDVTSTTDDTSTTEPLTTDNAATTTGVTTTDDVTSTTDDTSTTEPLTTDNAATTTDGTGDTTTAPTATDSANPTDNSNTGGEGDDDDDDTPDTGNPTLPATGRDGVKDMLTAALILFGFGGLTVSAARGRRSELLEG